MPTSTLLESTLLWGSLIGLVHFALIGALYGNPIVDRIYREAMEGEAGVKKWSSKPRYLVTQFAGTQLEIYALSFAYFWLRPLLGAEGIHGALLLGALLAAVRVYPRFWNMWIQSTYPNRLLAIEFVNGIISTLVVVMGLEYMAGS